MRLSLLVVMFMTAATFLMGGDGAPGVTYIGRDKVSAALAKGASIHRQSDLHVMGAHRSGGGQVELHDKETDVFYIVEGAAAFVAGGKMIGGKVSSPGQYLGTDIQGGQVYHLVKGDVIVIPAGIPHWYKEVPNSVSYFVVKVLKP